MKGDSGGGKLLNTLTKDSIFLELFAHDDQSLHRLQTQLGRGLQQLGGRHGHIKTIKIKEETLIDHGGAHEKKSSLASLFFLFFFFQSYFATLNFSPFAFLASDWPDALNQS